MRYTRSVLVAAIAGATVLTSPVAAEAASPTVTEVVRDGVTLLLERTPVSVRPYTGKGTSRADFDGDNRDDVAVFSNVGVAVAYSSAAHRDVLRTEIPGSGGGGFGYSMAAGNFNGDRYDDLAIGDYNEADLRNMGYVAGAVWIVPGGPGGLQPNRAQHFNQSTAGVPGLSVQGDWFGFSLAAGDITGDGRTSWPSASRASGSGTRRRPERPSCSRAVRAASPPVAPAGSARTPPGFPGRPAPRTSSASPSRSGGSTRTATRNLSSAPRASVRTAATTAAGPSPSSGERPPVCR
ncbi:FG-GAP repeat protein [Actinoplanes hulinensis]|uniref:FG-GAP repeat protein n=1 Tax=Actinoplanes hulinensis TaxID=1144547 RepID=A0ABS7AWP2_9ACTN|nr:FG-GAP repeat protein [Actinoplanes hulinensis]